MPKHLIQEYPEEEEYIGRWLRQFTTNGQYDDNSIELSDYWRECRKVVDNHKE